MIGLLFVNLILATLDCESSVCEPSVHSYARSDLACMVITTVRNHRTKADAAKSAWASRCGGVLYISAHADDVLPTTVIAGSEEGKIINKKVFSGFQALWARFPNAKWFIKADDDTFMHLDNLLALLGRYDHAAHAYIGRAGEFSNIRYCGGGAGYVLSQATLRDWVEHIPRCKRLPVGEDVSVGLCLRETLGLFPTWHAGFYHRHPSFFFHTAQGKKDHPEGLSPRPISFHSLTPQEQDVLSYVFYTATEPATGPWATDVYPTTAATH